MTRCTCVQAVREACAPLYATIVGLRAELAELRDHLSQANDTISVLVRGNQEIARKCDTLTACRTAADLQREREAEKAAWLKAYHPGVDAPDEDPRSATERHHTAPSAVWDDSSLTDEQLRVAIERRRAPVAEDGFEAHPWAWHAPDAGDVDA